MKPTGGRERRLWSPPHRRTAPRKSAFGRPARSFAARAVKANCTAHPRSAPEVLKSDALWRAARPPERSAPLEPRQHSGRRLVPIERRNDKIARFAQGETSIDYSTVEKRHPGAAP